MKVLLLLSSFLSFFWKQFSQLKYFLIDRLTQRATADDILLKPQLLFFSNNDCTTLKSTNNGHVTYIFTLFCVKLQFFWFPVFSYTSYALKLFIKHIFQLIDAALQKCWWIISFWYFFSILHSPVCWELLFLWKNICQFIIS